MHTDAERHELIEIGSLREKVSWWPFSAQSTYRRIRAGTLGSVAIGRRRFVTRALLESCIAVHTTGGETKGAA